MAPRILIVEDHKETALVMKEFLRDHGIAADIAHTGQQATKLAAKSNYACLLTDILLPDADGLQLAVNVRQRQNDIRVIIISAQNVAAADIRTTLGKDCQVIQKPCKLKTILTAVKRCSGLL